MACRIPAKKSCNSHLFGWCQPALLRWPFVTELSKAITFFLRSYPGEISRSNSPNRGLSNDLSDLLVRRRKAAVHNFLGSFQAGPLTDFVQELSKAITFLS